MNIKTILHFALGPIGGAFLGFITLPLTTWFFSVDDVGRISLLNVIVSLSVMFFSLGLDQAYVREFHEANDQKALWNTSFFPGFILLLIICILVAIFPEKISAQLFEVSSISYGLIILSIIFLSYNIRFFSLILRMQEKGLLFSLSQLLPKVLYLLILLNFILFTKQHNLNQLLIATLCSVLGVFILFLWNTRYERFTIFHYKIDIKQLRAMLVYSIPLFLSGLAFWGVNSIDRIMLKQLSTLKELGIFSIAMSFASVALILQSVFSVVWAPIVYKWVKNNEDMTKVFAITDILSFIVVALFSLAGLLSWIVSYILPNEYNTVQYLVLSCLGVPLFYIMSETTVIGINITKKTTYALLATLISLIIAIALNFLLIPLLGAAGAAISSCLTFFLFFLLRTEFSCLVWKSFPRLNLYIRLTLVVIITIFITLTNNTTPFTYIIWLVLLIYSICKLFLSYNQLIQLLKIKKI